MNEFEFASASVVGRDHRRSGRNNQDAYYVSKNDEYVVALVADGCGSSPHSEVGAQLGVRFAARIIANELKSRGLGGYLWINHALAGEINLLKRWLGGNPEQAIRDYLLFTLVGAVITPDSAEFFAFGDGVIVVNEQIIQPDFGNTPPYPAYQLIDGLDIPVEQLQFQVYESLPTNQLKTFVIGTDGAGDLINAAGRVLPGKTDKLVVPIEKMTEDVFFDNTDALRRYLTLVNRDITRLQDGELVRELGYLRDDTTLVMGRRLEALDCEEEQ